MSEFTAQIFVPQKTTVVAQVLRDLYLSGVILPIKRGSVVLVDYSHWEQIHAAFAASWSIHYTDDSPALNVQGYRGTACWLNLEFNPAPEDDPFELEELLDESGLYPDGSPGPMLALERSLQVIAQAKASGELSDEVATWLRQSLERHTSARQMMRLLPARLGFGVKRWLRPEDLAHRTREEWLDNYPKAVVLEAYST